MYKQTLIIIKSDICKDEIDFKFVPDISATHLHSGLRQNIFTYQICSRTTYFRFLGTDSILMLPIFPRFRHQIQIFHKLVENYRRMK